MLRLRRKRSVRSRENEECFRDRFEKYANFSHRRYLAPKFDELQKDHYVTFLTFLRLKKCYGSHC